MTDDKPRFYMGRISCVLLSKSKKKAHIMYLMPGRVGNKTEGYKDVSYGDKDIVPIRMLWRNRK